MKPVERSRGHTFGKNGFCVYCDNVHQTDRNARSTCSDGFRCWADEQVEAKQSQCKCRGIVHNADCPEVI